MTTVTQEKAPKPNGDMAERHAFDRYAGTFKSRIQGVELAEPKPTAIEEKSILKTPPTKS